MHFAEGCVITFALTKGGSGQFQAGYGTNGCAWFNVTPGDTIYSTDCLGSIIDSDISHTIWCVADARKDRVCTVETCLCAEFELRDFVPTDCGALVTWRVYNYCPGE